MTTTRTVRATFGGILPTSPKARIAVGIGVGVGVIFLWSAVAGATESGGAAGPPPLGSGCSRPELENRIAGAAMVTAQGGAAGAAAGPYGAAIGGGIGLLTGILKDPILQACAKKNAKNLGPLAKDAWTRVCKAADKIIAQMRTSHVALPRGINGWSCDQRIVFAAAVAGSPSALLGGRVAHATGAELQRFSDRATDAVNRAWKGGVVGGARGIQHIVDPGEAAKLIPDVVQNIFRPFGGLGRVPEQVAGQYRVLGEQQEYGGYVDEIRLNTPRAIALGDTDYAEIGRQAGAAAGAGYGTGIFAPAFYEAPTTTASQATVESVSPPPGQARTGFFRQFLQTGAGLFIEDQRTRQARAAAAAARAGAVPGYVWAGGTLLAGLLAVAFIFKRRS